MKHVHHIRVASPPTFAGVNFPPSGTVWAIGCGARRVHSIAIVPRPNTPTPSAGPVCGHAIYRDV
ncbi:hypothetical protein ABIA65_002356 [Mycolicibacterium sp. 624]